MYRIQLTQLVIDAACNFQIIKDANLTNQMLSYQLTVRDIGITPIISSLEVVFLPEDSVDTFTTVPTSEQSKTLDYSSKPMIFYNCGLYQKKNISEFI